MSAPLGLARRVRQRGVQRGQARGRRGSSSVVGVFIGASGRRQGQRCAVEQEGGGGRSGPAAGRGAGMAAGGSSSSCGAAHAPRRCRGSAPACRTRRPALHRQQRAGDARDPSSMDHCGRAGAARCGSSPRRPSRGRRGTSPGARAGRCLVGDAGLARCCRRQVLDEDVRRRHHGAGAARGTRRRAQQRDRAAVAVAEQPGQVPPRASAASSAGSTSCAWRCMKSRPQAPPAARRRAAVAGARVDQPRTPAASHKRLPESRATSPASPGPRAGRRAAARSCVPARSRRARCDRAPAPLDVDERRSVVWADPVLQFAQLEALDLAGGRLGQVGHELDLARVFRARACP